MAISNKIYFPNTTQTPNIIYDYWMAVLSCSQFKVLMFITRETFGYQGRETTNKDYSSIDLISERTGLNRETVILAIKELCDYELIIKIRMGKSNIYRINLYDPSQVGNSDLTDQVGNPDHIKSEIPTRNLQPHTYNTKENKSVCVEPELVAPNPLENVEKVKKMKPDGTAFEVSKNDLIHLAVRVWTDWTTEELDEMWIILRDYPDPIRDLVAFCDGTIKNRRKMAGIRNIKEKEKCKEKTHCQTKESPMSKKEFMAQGSWGLHFQNLKSPNSQSKE